MNNDIDEALRLAKIVLGEIPEWAPGDTAGQKLAKAVLELHGDKQARTDALMEECAAHKRTMAERDQLREALGRVIDAWAYFEGKGQVGAFDDLESSDSHPVRLMGYDELRKLVGDEK